MHAMSYIVKKNLGDAAAEVKAGGDAPCSGVPLELDKDAKRALPS